MVIIFVTFKFPSSTPSLKMCYQIFGLKNFLTLFPKKIVPNISIINYNLVWRHMYILIWNDVFLIIDFDTCVTYILIYIFSLWLVQKKTIFLYCRKFIPWRQKLQLTSFLAMANSLCKFGNSAKWSNLEQKGAVLYLAPSIHSI